MALLELSCAAGEVSEIAPESDSICAMRARIRWWMQWNDDGRAIATSYRQAMLYGPFDHLLFDHALTVRPLPLTGRERVGAP
jgi:hypothetical protein